MSEMATIPVFACRRCQKPVYVVHLSANNDPDAEKLKGFMQNLQKIALCEDCLKIYNYLASQNRSSEFYVNPHITIYNVVDNSTADYYNRKQE